MKHKSRIVRLAACLVSALLLMSMLYQTVLADVGGGRSAARARISTSGNLADIRGLQEIDVTVEWTDTLNMKEPVTIRATDGVILVDNASDIQFTTDGVAGQITDLSIENGAVSFFANAVAINSYANKLVFKVQAPIQSEAQFKISTKIGLESTPALLNFNYVEKELTVAKGFSINTSEDIIVGDRQFEVFGDLGLNQEGKEYFTVLDVYNKDSLEPIYEFQNIAFPVNDSYTLGNFTFPSSAESGTYVVVVSLFDGDEFVTSFQKEIEYQSALSVVLPSEVRFGESFYITGQLASNINNSIVAVDAFNKNDPDEYVYEFSLTEFPINSQYSIGPLVFPEQYSEGIYVIQVTLYDEDSGVTTVVTKEVNCIR